jgi:hypothetical protein
MLIEEKFLFLLGRDKSIAYSIDTYGKETI